MVIPSLARFLSLVHLGAEPDALALPRAPTTVINGTPATAEELPMSGALMVEFDALDGGGRAAAHECSSTLIAPDVILTAAHCVDLQVLEAAGLEAPALFWTREADLFRYLIALELGEPSPALPEDVIAVDSVVAHPDFAADAGQLPLGRANDIALVYLAEAVTDVPFAFLPTEADGIDTGARATVVGWGLAFAEIPETPESYAGVKRRGVSTIGDSGPWEFQFGVSAEQARQCNGDSGGPIFAGESPDDDAYVTIVGVASRTADQSLCETKGAINTRVLPYRDWIEAQMIAACEDGRRVACNDPGLATADDSDVELEDGGESGGCTIGTFPTAAPWWLVVLSFGGRRRFTRSRD